MEATLTPSRMFAIIEKVRSISEMCRISKIEKILADTLGSVPNSSSINYIGELNKNDIMH